MRHIAPHLLMAIILPGCQHHNQPPCFGCKSAMMMMGIMLIVIEIITVIITIITLQGGVWSATLGWKETDGKRVTCTEDLELATQNTTHVWNGGFFLYLYLHQEFRTRLTKCDPCNWHLSFLLLYMHWFFLDRRLRACYKEYSPYDWNSMFYLCMYL